MQPHFTTDFLLSAASALAVGRLLHLGLVKRFPALVAWLIYSCIAPFILALLSPRTILYFWIYVTLLPIGCLLGVVAVRELFALIFDKYPGIRTVGRWAMYGAIAISLAASLAATKIFWSVTASGRAHSGIYYLQVGHRSVVFSLAIIIISLLFSISRYPLHLGQNTYVCCGFFGVVFLSEAAQSLMDSLAPRLFNHYIDWATNLFVALCLCAWATWIAREAESSRAMAASVVFSSPAEDHLLQELASLNQMLAKAARR